MSGNLRCHATRQRYLKLVRPQVIGNRPAVSTKKRHTGRVKAISQKRSRLNKADPGKPCHKAEYSSDDDNLCAICLEKEQTMVIVPCGHKCLCEDCVDTIKAAGHPRCPICNDPFDDIKA